VLKTKGKTVPLLATKEKKEEKKGKGWRLVSFTPRPFDEREKKPPSPIHTTLGGGGGAALIF